MDIPLMMSLLQAYEHPRPPSKAEEIEAERQRLAPEPDGGREPDSRAAENVPRTSTADEPQPSATAPGCGAPVTPP